LAPTPDGFTARSYVSSLEMEFVGDFFNIALARCGLIRIPHTQALPLSAVLVCMDCTRPA